MQSIEKFTIEQETDDFQDRVFDDECLLSWFRGHLSDAEILDRLKYLKLQAQERGQGAEPDYDAISLDEQHRDSVAAKYGRQYR